MTHKQTLQEHIEKIEKEFDEEMKIFGYKYLSDDTHDSYAVSKSFLDARFKEVLISKLREIATTTLEAVKMDGERLKEANSLLRSAYSIAQRKGLQTNWEAFEGEVKKELDMEHAAITEQNKKAEEWLKP